LNIKPEIKILLVDDREDNLLSIESILEKDGYTFYKANSGKQALKILLSEYDFSLILMDVKMPDLNGFETATLIYERDRLKHIPIIFITAYDKSDENTIQGFKFGAVDFIYKPINPNLLRAKVSVFVDLYKKNHQLMAQEQKLIAINNELEERVKERTEELSRKNSELESINVELKKINTDLDNFVYTASHDLKAPISNLEGLMSVLIMSLDKKLDEKEKKFFDLINVSISKFNKTIGDLTEISKAQKNSEEEVESISFKEVLDDVKVDISNLIDSNHAVITEDFSVETISYARKNLRSIFYNLITNAIKYRDRIRPVKIHVKTVKKENQILLTIEDNGLGLSKDQQAKLFTMFKRLHSHVDGSGIGLYIIKRVIENNGGKIEVDSKEGIGSKFKIYFRE
jgi:two-component system, sensor histidine kinase and response regulator